MSVGAALTLKQRKLCEYVAAGMNQTQAAIGAGYAKSAASQTAARMMALAKVKAYHEELLTPKLRHIETTQINTLRELAAIAHADPAQLFDEAGKILPIKKMPEEIRRAIKSIKLAPDGSVVEVRLESKPAALALLGRYHHLWDQPLPPPPPDEPRVAGQSHVEAVELIQRLTPQALQRPAITGSESKAEEVER